MLAWMLAWSLWIGLALRRARQSAPSEAVPVQTDEDEAIADCYIDALWATASVTDMDWIAVSDGVELTTTHLGQQVICTGATLHEAAAAAWATVHGEDA